MWSDNETAIDLLGFQHLANAVVTIVQKDELLPATIGVYGDWGSGKSSLIQVIQKELEKDEGVAVITFNGWLFEGYEDAKTALMGSILEELIDQKRFSSAVLEKAKGLLKRVDGFKLAGGIGKIALGLATGGFPLAIGGGFDLLSFFKTAGEKAKDVKAEDFKGIIKEKSDKDDDENFRRSIRKFRKDFGELLDESKIKKLVVVIDDLDRCLPDTIIETLEAIKLFLFVKNTAFILGADERLVKYAVRKRFPELPGERVEVGRDYLEKLVQFPVRVPPLGRAEMETYISLLFMQLSELNAEQQEKARYKALEMSADSLTGISFNLAAAEKLFGEQLPLPLKEQLGLAGRVAPLLSASLKGNPRQCKRFLNTLLMRLDMARYRNVQLQQRVLAKLMLLEYFKPESFRRLAELQAEQEGEPREIALMEREAVGVETEESGMAATEKIQDSGKLTEKIAEPKSSKKQTREAPVKEINKSQKLDGEFKSWLGQNWTHEWLRLEPTLSGVDLRSYFFFSRDILVAPLGGESSRMSPLAQEIFAGLSSESQTMQKTALGKAKDLSIGDAIAVFETLSQRAQQEEEFGTDNQALQRLFDWADARSELRGELVQMLRRLPESSISTVVIPKLLNLCKKHESESAARELLDKWSNSTANRTLADTARSRLNQAKTQ